MNRDRGVFLAAVTLAVFLTSSTWGAVEAFHPPHSDAEKALDVTLSRAASDGMQLDNLLQGRGKPNFRPTVDYSTMLTPQFLAKLRLLQRKIVAGQCARSFPASICGLEFSPVDCQQEQPSLDYYRTEETGPNQAVISYTWYYYIERKQNLALATFRMVKTDGRWKINAVNCISDLLAQLK